MTIHVQGSISTELNAKKGIWCEFCQKDCSKDHLITIVGMSQNSARELVCVQCAADLITCLRKSLMDALLTNKETIC